jgi:hypothetical protein
MSNIIEDIFIEHPQWTTKQIQEETKRRGAKDGHGYSKRQIRRRLNPLKNGPTSKEINRSELKEEIIRDYNGDTAYISTKSWKITTVEDAIEKAGVDTELWEKDRYLINSWEVTMSGDKSSTKEDTTYTNWQVKVWLKRKVPSILEVRKDILMEEMKIHSPIYSYPHISVGNRRFMYEIDLFDIHYGKKAWEKETGENYDCDIAEERSLHAMSYHLNQLRGEVPELILFPIGNDFLHIDTPEGTTTRGTSQDSDDRLSMLFKNGIHLLVNMIEMCASVAPTEVLVIPGNHDWLSTINIGTALEGWFQNNDRVAIDDSPRERKYKHYGANLVGFVHGSRDDPPPDRLPLIMAEEMKDVWSLVKFKEWHTGHTHKKKEMKYLSADSFGGVTFEVIPSITGTDKWHYQKGFVGALKRSVAQRWDYEDGKTAVNYCIVNLDGV